MNVTAESICRFAAVLEHDSELGQLSQAEGAQEEKSLTGRRKHGTDCLETQAAASRPGFVHGAERLDSAAYQLGGIMQLKGAFPVEKLA